MNKIRPRHLKRTQWPYLKQFGQVLPVTVGMTGKQVRKWLKEAHFLIALIRYRAAINEGRFNRTPEMSDYHRNNQLDLQRSMMQAARVGPYDRIRRKDFRGDKLNVVPKGLVLNRPPRLNLIQQPTDPVAYAALIKSLNP